MTEPVNARQSSSGLAFDARIQQRDVLLDETQMTQRLSLLLEQYGCPSVDSCRRLRTKYRVGVSLRALHEVNIDGNTYKIAARTFPIDRAANVFANANSSRVSLDSVPPTFWDEELSTVFWTFPNDRKIRNLSVLTNVPDDLVKINGSTWTNSQLVAHAPEKSVTAKCLNESADILAYAKIYAGDDGRGTSALYDDISRTLQRSNNLLKVPRSLGYAEAHHTLLLEAISGEPLSQLNQEHRTNSFFDFGVSLANLHSIPPPNYLGVFKRLRPEGLRKAARVIAKCRPDVAWRTSGLVEQLINTFERTDAPHVLLHGDVHPKNAIVTNDGLALIDLDQAGIGPAAADLGSLVAALRYEQCVGRLTKEQRVELTESFLGGYASKRRFPGERTIQWHTAAALLEERALRAVNRVRIEGLLHMDRILDSATNILNRNGH